MSPLLRFLGRIRKLITSGYRTGGRFTEFSMSYASVKLSSVCSVVSTFGVSFEDNLRITWNLAKIHFVCKFMVVDPDRTPYFVAIISAFLGPKGKIESLSKCGQHYPIIFGTRVTIDNLGKQ